MSEVLTNDNQLFIYDEFDTVINPLKSDLNKPNSKKNHIDQKYITSIIISKLFKYEIITIQTCCKYFV